ncbi:MAG: hypothetical protein SFW08_01800 [Gemmatimonadaceae bacterium]|nr:hypothetical protein [Gemmatimonadaceae bacterium]
MTTPRDTSTTQEAAADSSIPVAVLRAAVTRGVITEAQLTALLAAASPESARGMRAAERLISHGTTSIGIAYRLGAALVVLAAGWFLADYWRDLGAGGVLALGGGYALAAALAARALHARGYEQAAGYAATIIVALTPVVTWAFLTLVGWWGDGVPDLSTPDGFDRLLALEGAALAASLVARRFVETRLHVLLVVVSLTAVVLTLPRRVLWPSYPADLETWVAFVWAGACALLGYAEDRAVAQDADRAPDAPDIWYTAAAISAAVAITTRWTWFGAWHHVLAPSAGLGMLWAATRLGRRQLAAIGLVWTLAYCTSLVGDVLADVVGAPAAMAGLGLLLLLGTVWAQRRYPSLVRDALRWTPKAALALPGGWLTASLPLLAALGLVGTRVVAGP